MSDLSINITDEIWMEILKRLPVKTLGQCRCVCKPWNKLVVSPPFISTHLKNYTQNAANSLLLYRQFSNALKKQEQYTLFIESPEGKDGNNLEVCHTFPCPFIAAEHGYHFRIVGSANGLLCLSDDLFGYTYVVLLWNPLIHKYIKLPVPLATYHVSIGAYISMLGFGYDSKKDDYKVVRLVYLRGKDMMDITPPKVELYSVQEGKWRWVSAEYLENVCVSDIRWSHCFLNGNTHWISWERDAQTRVFQSNWLLLFDVEEEKFKKMKLPKQLSKVNTLNLSVSDYDGKLSVMYSELKGGFTGKEMSHCEIWVKEEYKLGLSWRQMVKIELDSSCSLGWVQCLRRPGDVLGITKQGTLVSYDPTTKETKSLKLSGGWRSWFTCGFTESLALLDKEKGVRTYNKLGKHKKKRFSYNIDPKTQAQTVEEKEVKVYDGDEKDPFDNMYFQRTFMICKQLMKFNGGKSGGDLSEFMSGLGLF